MEDGDVKEDNKLIKEDKTSQHRHSNLNKCTRYETFIYRVLKQVFPEDVQISKSAVIILNNIVCDILGRLSFEAGRIARYNNRQTITYREIQSAVKLIFPGELLKHAIVEGNKAVDNYNNTKKINEEQ